MNGRTGVQNVLERNTHRMVSQTFTVWYPAVRSLAGLHIKRRLDYPRPFRRRQKKNLVHGHLTGHS